MRLRGGQTTSLSVAIPPHPGRPANPTPTPSPHSTGSSTPTPTPKPPKHSTPTDAIPAKASRSPQASSSIRRKYHLPSHADRLRAQGLLTANELAQRLYVHRSTIKNWTRAGILNSHKANDKNVRLYQPPIPGDPASPRDKAAPSENEFPPNPAPGGAL